MCPPSHSTREAVTIQYESFISTGEYVHNTNTYEIEINITKIISTSPSLLLKSRDQERFHMKFMNRMPILFFSFTIPLKNLKHDRMCDGRALCEHKPQLNRVYTSIVGVNLTVAPSVDLI